MDYSHICLGCMGEKGDVSECPFCSWIENYEPESPQHLAPGTILHEKYLIGRVLGQGGFGTTYLGWDINLKLKLAIKEYLPQDLASRTAGSTQVTVFTTSSYRNQFEYGLEKFLLEAQTLAQFEGHPNIVSVRDFFRANGTAYIVMSYVEGVTLKEHLALSGDKIEVNKALAIIMPVLDALAEVHTVNILHRDISPDNIYINRKGQVILIDFGAARQAIGEKGKSLSIILKPGYAPEEQYRSKGLQGPWTDVYAVAATLYRMITGKMPPESLDRLAEDTLVPPSHYGIDINETEERAIQKALTVRAEDRFKTVKEFQQALVVERSAQEIHSAEFTIASNPPPPPTPPPPIPANSAMRKTPEANDSRSQLKVKSNKVLRVIFIIAAALGVLFTILIVATIVSNDSDTVTDIETVFTVPNDYKTIQEAIDDVADGSVIIIEPGTYNESIDYMGKNIVIRSTDPDDPDIVNNTIIKGVGNGPVVSIRHGEGPEAMLIGLHITGGTGVREMIDTEQNGETVSLGLYVGGGILIMSGASPTIENNIIRNNDCAEENNGEGLGGGITVIGNSSATIIGNTISHNTANLSGGIIVTYNSNAMIKENIIEENTAPFISNSEFLASGVTIGNNSNATIENNMISGNTSNYIVNGIFVVNNSDATIKGNDITANQADYMSNGIMIAENSTATIEYNRIQENTSGNMCGGITISGLSSATIRNNSIDDNSADICGGVIVLDNSSTEITDNSIRGNIAKDLGGGVLLMEKSTALVSNNTLENNSATSVGGALFSDYTSKLELDDPDSNTYNGNKPNNIYQQ